MPSMLGIGAGHLLLKGELPCVRIQKVGGLRFLFGFCVDVLGRTDKKRTEAQTDQTVLCPCPGQETEGRTRTSESPPVTGVKSR